MELPYKVKEKLNGYVATATYITMTYYKFITIFALIGVFWIGIALNNVANAIDANTKATKERNRYAVVANNNWQIRGLETEKLTDGAYKFVIAGIIERYLVKSAYDLTLRAGKKSFKDIQEFHKSQTGGGGLKEFFEVYVISKTDNKEHKEYAQLGIEDYKKFLRKLNILLRRKELPVVKDTLGVNNADIAFAIKDNKFSIEVKIHMYVAGVALDGTTYTNRPTYGVFKLKGYVDIDESHPVLNPLGVKFFAIEAEPALNPDEGVNRKINTEEKPKEPVSKRY